MVSINELPVSSFFKEYYLKNGYSLTDFQKAVIVANSRYYDKFKYGDQIGILREIMKSTADKGLAVQISEHLNYKEKFCERFKNNQNYQSKLVFPENTHGLDQRFEDAFIELEYPFERGDIVWDIYGYDIGVICTSKNDFYDSQNRLMNNITNCNSVKPDITDVDVRLENINKDDGNLFHYHLPPYCLEPLNEEMSVDNAYLKVLREMSTVMTGRGCLWDLDILISDYKRTVK